MSHCRNGWDSFGDHRYCKHDILNIFPGMAWNDSRLVCQSYGGDLLSITSQVEQRFITSRLKPGFKSLPFYWIGFTDEGNEGNWRWIDGSETKFTNWNFHQPNNWKGNENCAFINPYGKWADNDCAREFGFICKKYKGRQFDFVRFFVKELYAAELIVRVTKCLNNSFQEPYGKPPVSCRPVEYLQELVYALSVIQKCMTSNSYYLCSVIHFKTRSLY